MEPTLVIELTILVLAILLNLTGLDFETSLMTGQALQNEDNRLRLHSQTGNFRLCFVDKPPVLEHYGRLFAASSPKSRSRIGPVGISCSSMKRSNRSKRFQGLEET